MEIKDSGERRTFETGAVRDAAEGRGRCDLLPLDCVADYFKHFDSPIYMNSKVHTVSVVLEELNTVQYITIIDGTAEKHIINAIEEFIRIAFEDKFGYAMMELAKHYEAGAIKYAERNWQKGIPCHCYIDSCVRHLLKWYDGWDDEPHDRAVLWNLFGLMWTLEHKPELNDMPCNKKEGDSE